MIALQQYLSRNLFTLILSTIGAITAILYNGFFLHPPLWGSALWMLTTFFIFYLTTHFIIKFLSKISSTRIKVLLYSLYTITTLLIVNLFIFPVVFLLTGDMIEDNKHSICCETPLEYGVTEYQTENFKLADGVTISGWYIPPTTHKNSLIILIHGHYADRRATREWAKILTAAGYGIYMYDQRGHGESEGVLDYVNSNFAADLLSIRQQLLAKYSVKQFGAVGLSMGAHALINTFAQDPSAFQAAWLDGLWPQAAKDLDVFCLEMLLYSNLETVTQIIFKNPAPNVKSLLDILTENKTAKIMVVAAGAEDMESSTGRKLATAKSNMVDNWVIPNAKHLNGISIASDEYKQKLLDFFKAL